METIIDQLAKIEKEAISTLEESKKEQHAIAEKHKRKMEQYDLDADVRKENQLKQMKQELRDQLEAERKKELEKVVREISSLVDYYQNHIAERVQEIISEKRN